MSVPSVRVRRMLNALTKLSGDLLGQRIAIRPDVADQLHRRLGAGLEDLLGEAPDLHAMFADQRGKRARIVGVHVRGHVVIAGLRRHPHDFLQVFGQLAVLGLADHQFGGKARFDEAGEVVVLGDLVEAEREVVVRPHELGGIQRARLQCREDLARRKVGDRRAQLRPHLPAKARGAEAQPLDVAQAGQLLAEPAAGLRPRIAAEEALHAELVVDLVPDFLAAHIAHPGGQLARGHAERHAREKAQALALVLPVIGRAVAHFRRPVDDGVERAQPRHHFARREHLHGQPAARGLGDPVRDLLRADPEAREVLGPGGDHAPGDIALRDRRHGEPGCGNGGRGAEKLTSLH